MQHAILTKIAKGIAAVAIGAGAAWLALVILWGSNGLVSAVSGPQVQEPTPTPTISVPPTPTEHPFSVYIGLSSANLDAIRDAESDLSNWLQVNVATDAESAALSAYPYDDEGSYFLTVRAFYRISDPDGQSVQTSTLVDVPMNAARYAKWTALSDLINNKAQARYGASAYLEEYQGFVRDLEGDIIGLFALVNFPITDGIGQEIRTRKLVRIEIR